MISIIGAGLFSIVIILTILIICGLPLGELTMGGQYKVFPPKLRIVLFTQLILQVFFVIIIDFFNTFQNASFNNIKIMIVVNLLSFILFKKALDSNSSKKSIFIVVIWYR